MPDPLAAQEAGDGAQVSAVTITSRRAPRELLPYALGRRSGDGTPRRTWTPMGTLAHGVTAELDAAGAVALRGRSWMLDWWVGAQDRWHHPGAEASVRQQPVQDSPVMRTVLRVPGGHVEHRAVGAVSRGGGSGSGNADVVAVEIHNSSPVPVALALVLRPWRLDRPGFLHSVELDGLVVRADGEQAVVLPRRPARVAHGAAGSTALRLARGQDGPPEGRWTAEGDLEVALVFPLAHGATLQVMLPGEPVTADVSGPAAPSLDAVISGWVAHTRQDPAAGLPVEAWGSLVSWSGAILRVAGAEEVTRALDREAVRPVGGDAGRRVGAVAAALAGLAVPELHDAVAGALRSAQRRRGEVRMADGSDATAALLFAAAATLSGPRRDDRADELLDPVARALRHLARRRGPRRWAQARREAVASSRIAAALMLLGQPELAAEALDSAGRGLDPVAGPVAGVVDRRGEVLPGSTFELAEGLHRDVLEHRADAVGALGRHLARRGSAGTGDALDEQGHPCGEVGFDVAELAELRLTLLDLLACDGAGGPLLFAGWSTAWPGQDLECHRVPTAWGPLSAALRWHGPRPAVFWEIEPVLGARSSVVPELRTPSLDPAWRGRGWTGEALLGEISLA